MRRGGSPSSGASAPLPLLVPYAARFGARWLVGFALVGGLGFAFGLPAFDDE